MSKKTISENKSPYEVWTGISRLSNNHDQHEVQSMPEILITHEKSHLKQNPQTNTKSH
jgi:hypothetical protein